MEAIFQGVIFRGVIFLGAIFVRLTGPWPLNIGFPEGHVCNKYNVTLIY